MRTRINFEGGKCLSIEVRIPGAPGQPAENIIRVVPELVGAGLLSMTDRMSLSLLADRVERLAGEIVAGAKQ